jgi:hypothetical protein
MVGGRRCAELEEFKIGVVEVERRYGRHGGSRSLRAECK